MILVECDFYPRPPRGGRHCGARLEDGTEEISIHALREEGDCCRQAEKSAQQNFYPRPPRGGRHLSIFQSLSIKFISIHALREEGDRFTRRWTSTSTNFYPRPPRGGRLDGVEVMDDVKIFLSTPSARRATAGHRGGRRRVGISIHALREEGDDNVAKMETDFDEFLSTPSARRATAKTEKNISAFVSL